MQLPERLPGVRWITMTWGVAMVVWATLEGGLWVTVFAAVLSCIVVLGHLANRVLSGRGLAFGVWLLVSAVFGALLGLGSALLTLLFMAIKTGLHAHGAEFSTMEINWVLQQIPIWMVAGLLGGLGMGLVLKALATQTE